MNLKVIAAMINEEAAEQLKNAVSRIRDITFILRLPRIESDLASIGKSEAPDVLIVEIGDDFDADIDNIASLLSEHGDHMAVYVIYTHCSSETMRRLVKAGVKEFLPLPLQSQELVLDLMELLSQKRSRVHEHEQSGGLTAFLNAKGGAGSTLLATNTALTLATDFDVSVALIDFDIQFGSAAMYLDLSPRSSIMDAFIDVDRIDPVFVKALMTHHKSGLDVLAAPPEIEPINGIITVEGVKRLLDVTAELYDFVILDVPRLFSPWSIAALKQCDTIMLVSHHDLSNIRDARLILDAMPKMEISTSNVEIINNRAMTHVEDTSVESMKETLHKARVHRVRNDYKAAIHAEENGAPVSQIAGHSDLTKDINALARYLAEKHLGKQEEKGFFGNLFGRKSCEVNDHDHHT